MSTDRRPATWTIATTAQCRADAETLIYGAPIPGRRTRAQARTDADLLAAALASAEHCAYLAAEAGLPGIERGAHVTYLADDGEHRGTFARITEFGTGSGRNFRRTALYVVINATGGGRVAIDPALVERAAAPALPECSGFTGTGRRCTACRVHRSNHA